MSDRVKDRLEAVYMVALGMATVALAARLLPDWAYWPVMLGWLAAIMFAWVTA